MRYNSIENGSPCQIEKLSQISGVKPFRITLLEMRIFNESQKFLTKSHMFHYFHNVRNKCSIKSVIQIKAFYGCRCTPQVDIFDKTDKISDSKEAVLFIVAAKLS